MAINNTPSIPPKDTPETRKCRLEERLKEISEKGEKELANIIKTVNKLKKTVKPQP